MNRHDVNITKYHGIVSQCTIPACDNKPAFCAQLDGKTGPGENQVACRAHIGDVAGNMIKGAYPTKPTVENTRVVWEDDWEVDHAEEYDCYEDGGPSTCETAILYDENGNYLASLGCIDDADDAYRKEVEANLYAEAGIEVSTKGGECDSCTAAGRTYDPDKHDSQNCWV